MSEACRSECLVSLSVDVFGEMWSPLILRGTLLPGSAAVIRCAFVGLSESAAAPRAEVGDSSSEPGFFDRGEHRCVPRRVDYDAGDALVDREYRPRDEEPDRNEQRPEKAILAVAEGIFLPVGHARLLYADSRVWKIDYGFRTHLMAPSCFFWNIS